MGKGKPFLLEPLQGIHPLDLVLWFDPVATATGSNRKVKNLPGTSCRADLKKTI
jgi:hypothetical protein